MKRFFQQRIHFSRGVFLLYLLAITHILCGQEVMVSSDIIKGYESAEILPCMIVMQDQWVAPEFIKEWTKEEKGKFVFEGLKTHALKNQVKIISYFENESINYESFYIFNGLRAMLSYQQLSELQKLSGIQSILLDKSSPMQVLDKAQSYYREEIEWGLSQIQADKVWELGSMGNGVVIAGQDTGYDFDNPFIYSNYRGNNAGSLNHNYNWHDAIHTLNPNHNDGDENPERNPCGLNSDIPCDDNSHGTHTMGTMVGNDPDIKIGVAPKAEWIGCRNMDRGWGSPSTYTECFEWFLAPTALDGLIPDPSRSPHVINNSWGCPEVEGCNPENWMFMENVINNLVAAGIMVVVSAGNDGLNGCSSINSPASMFDASFVVGATDNLDVVAPFSSYGPVTIDGSGRYKPDVVAPGVAVISITLNGFGTWSGTSMAGPHVAGTVALMIDANPKLAGHVEEIERILKETALPVKDERSCDGIVADLLPNFVAGYGRINALAAVNEAISWINTTDENNFYFNLYPNPSSDVVSLTYNNRFSISGTLQAYDILGRFIWETEVGSGHITIDVHSWPPGNYFFLHRNNEEIIQLGRFVKI